MSILDKYNNKAFTIHKSDKNTVLELLEEYGQVLTDYINIADESLDFLDWLKNSGLSAEVKKEFTNRFNNGEFKNLNNELINTVNENVNKNINSLQTNINSLGSNIVNTERYLKGMIDNLVLNAEGDSTPEVVQARTTKRGIPMKTLSSNIDNIYNLLTTDKEIYTLGGWIQGAITSAGLDVDNSFYIRTDTYITFYKGDKVRMIVPEGYQLRVLRMNGTSTYVSGTLDKDRNFLCDTTTMFRFALCKTGATEEIYPEEGDLFKIEIERKLTVNKQDCGFINDNACLVDSTNVEFGKVLAGNEVQDSAPYCITPFIPLLPGQPIYVSDYRNYFLYDKNFNSLLGITEESTTKTKIVVDYDLYTNTEYIRFTARTDTVDNLYISYSDFNNDNKKERGYYLEELKVTEENLSTPLKSIINKANSINLSGKTIISLGDSIMQGASGITAPIKTIADKHGMTFKNYAVGGATVTSNSSNNINAQIDKITETTVDYIVFNGLTNDINTDTNLLGEVSEGYESTYDLTSFSGAFENIIYRLRDKFPNAKILYVRPHNMSSRDKNKQITFGERAIDICKKWSIKYVDLFNESGLNGNIIKMRNLYTVHTYEEGVGDSTHPNALGYSLFYLPLIESNLNMI